jgi:HD-GYP domain-containing protein (c-di-GMP phosphodiesterase class II)
MNSTRPAPDEQLLHDLVGSLVAARDDGVSIGVVGPQAPAAQPPRHCLRACLDGDPARLAERGCAYLRAAAQSRLEPAALRNGCCERGFRVTGQPAALGGQSVILLTVQGAPAAPAAGGGPDLLGQLECVQRVVQRVDQVLAENTGFADEVLRNYEQLSLIFDLTQQIAQLTDVRAIERLLMQRVGQLLAAETVQLHLHAGECRAHPPQHDALQALLPPEQLVALLAGVRQSRQAQVAGGEGRQLILAPLQRLDGQIDVVLARRAAGAPAYNSGDMLVLESLLTLGGQIISNCELHERLRRMSMEVTRALVAAIDKKDHYTSGHSERGGFLTRRTAVELGLPAAEQQSMEWAGLLHDVGKIGIPEEILCKSGKLTPEEFEVIKQHPRMGYEILKPIASLGMVLDGVLYHHEYPDGSGYPAGLAGDEIPLVARIIHVVDTFDALTSTRSYRKAFSVERAIEIIRAEKGVRIDAEAAEAFFRAFARYRADEPADFAERFAHTLATETVHA